MKLLSALVAGLWVGWCYVTHGRAAVPAPARAQVTHISAARRARAVHVRRPGTVTHLTAAARLRRRGPYRC